MIPGNEIGESMFEEVSGIGFFFSTVTKVWRVFNPKEILSEHKGNKQ